MDRLLPTLVLLLIVSVLGLGFVVVRADQRSHRDAERLACIERAQSLASISLMAPPDRVDGDGRVQSMKVLAKRIEAC